MAPSQEPWPKLRSDRAWSRAPSNPVNRVCRLGNLLRDVQEDTTWRSVLWDFFLELPFPLNSSQVTVSRPFPNMSYARNVDAYCKRVAPVRRIYESLGQSAQNIGRDMKRRTKKRWAESDDIFQAPGRANKQGKRGLPRAPEAQRDLCVVGRGFASGGAICGQRLASRPGFEGKARCAVFE